MYKLVMLFKTTYKNKINLQFLHQEIANDMNYNYAVRHT